MKNQPPSDPLDRLLERQPLPEAPAWFEARVMARIRREREAGWRGRLARWSRETGLGEMLKPALVSGALALVVAFWASTGTPGPSATGVSAQEINKALDAYASYNEQVSSWNIALY